METPLNLKHELDVSHKTSPTLEVFSVCSAKSFMPINCLATWEKGVRKRDW